ncbi:unnamed protein product [Paramecium octaurelia]|uniref:Uncharacterized protein n=1 Tax=Paramecium octaurelia TaxID=43137 RepID=A0A8S1XXC6_PAROT|nr:unnamed protein product [Paramecium octaurelia]
MKCNSKRMQILLSNFKDQSIEEFQISKYLSFYIKFPLIYQLLNNITQRFQFGLGGNQDGCFQNQMGYSNQQRNLVKQCVNFCNMMRVHTYFEKVV